MDSTIKEFASERGIKYLMHFTRATNLDSILQRGLILRDRLIAEGYNEFNDMHRYDGTSAICMSIDFPNYKMFWGLRKDNPNVEWIILVIAPEVMWTFNCAFCATNAATTAVANTALTQRCTLEGLRAMYADWEDKSRSLLNIPSNYPTNPQSEILILEGIPSSLIMGVFVQNEDMKKKLKSKYPNLEVKVNEGYFSYRSDFAHWKKEN
jgi:hypothetical protein